MKLLTQAEIEYIIECAEMAWAYNKLPKSRKIEYITTLRSFITDSGTIENVCQHCLGSGRKK